MGIITGITPRLGHQLGIMLPTGCLPALLPRIAHQRVRLQQIAHPQELRHQHVNQQELQLQTRPHPRLIHLLLQTEHLLHHPDPIIHPPHQDQIQRDHHPDLMVVAEVHVVVAEVEDDNLTEKLRHNDQQERGYPNWIASFF